MFRQLVLLFLSSFTCASVAQTVDVSVLIDRGGSGGCTVIAADPVGSVDARLTASVDPATAQVDELTLETCQEGAFGPPQALDGGYPVGLNNGEGGADVVELSVHANQLGTSFPQYSFTMVANDGSAVDQARGGSLGISVPVPLAPGAMLLLAFVLALIGLWAFSRHRGPSALLLGLVALPALAAHFMLDGDVSDWTETRAITDSTGDASAESNRADILATFAAAESRRLWFRIDLADIENFAPSAADDALATDEDTVLTGENVLADNGAGADSDPNGDTLTVAGFDATSAGGATVTIAANGDLDYDPTGVSDFQALAAGESQDDTFTYTIEDPDGRSDTATVTITVGGANDLPTANDDAFTTSENSPVTTGSALANDTDPDAGDLLSVDSLDTSATAGLVTDNGDGSFDYDPNGQFDSLGSGEIGIDSFAYTATDGNGGTDSATVTITVNGTNDAPVASQDAFTTDEDSVLSTGNVLANDTDAEGDTLGIDSVDTAGTVGSVTSNGDGTFDYDPSGQFDTLAAGENATDSFAYTVTDGNGGTDTATVTITINGLNEAPVARDDSFLTDKNTALTNRNLLIDNGSGGDSDPNGDALTVSAFDATSAQGATVSITANGELDYDPTGAAALQALALGESVVDTFSYTVDDGNGATATATVTVSVTGMPVSTGFIGHGSSGVSSSCSEGFNAIGVDEYWGSAPLTVDFDAVSEVDIITRLPNRIEVPEGIDVWLEVRLSSTAGGSTIFETVEPAVEVLGDGGTTPPLFDYARWRNSGSDVWLHSSLQTDPTAEGFALTGVRFTVPTPAAASGTTTSTLNATFCFYIDADSAIDPDERFTFP